MWGVKKNHNKHISWLCFNSAVQKGTKVLSFEIGDVTTQLQQALIRCFCTVKKRNVNSNSWQEAVGNDDKRCEQVNGDLKWDSRMPDVGEMQNLVNKLEVEVHNCSICSKLDKIIITTTNISQKWNNSNFDRQVRGKVATPRVGLWPSSS